MKDHHDEASSVVFDPSDSYDSTTLSGPRSGHDDAEVLEEVIAQKETKVVGCLKIVVLLVLAISATIVATTVHSYLSHAEQAKFEAAFQDDASKIFQAIGTSLDKSFGLLDSLAVLYVSYAKMSNQTWPFVTMPDFAIRLAKILPLTDAIAVNVLPVVTPENRKKWEAYSVANDYWVNEGMAIQETWDGYYGPVVYNGTKYGVIHSDYGNLPYNVTYEPVPCERISKVHE
jgi:hypothetical protein